MEIRSVYDFEGPSGYFFNALNPIFLKYFQNIEYNFDKDSEGTILSEVGRIGTSRYDIISCKSESIYDINCKNNPKILFNYNIYTGGDLKASLGYSAHSKSRDSIFSFFSKKAISYLKKYDNFYATIYFGMEHDIDMEDIERFYISCLENSIPRNKIVILSNILNPEQIISTFKKKYKIIDDVNFIFFNLNEVMMFKGDELNSESNEKYFVKESQIVLQKSKKYLFLNKRLRPHRLILLSLMAYDGLLDNGMVSFNMEYHNTDYFIDYINNNNYLNVDKYFDITQYHNKTFDEITKTKILDGYRILLKLKKRTLDIDDIESIEERSFEIDDKSLYINSYFSIVGETEFFNDYKRYSTEKILKPIQQLHPFIVLGRPYLLSDLHSYGFKTFHDFWDESYDIEECNNIRMIKIYKIIYELNNKSDSEWQYIYKNITPILIHNRDLLKNLSGENKRIIFETNFYKNLINETDKNYKRLF